MTPVPFCADMRPECERRFKEMGEALKSIADEQREQGKSIAALRAQVAAWAAFGALAGGGLVTMLTHLLK